MNKIKEVCFDYAKLGFMYGIIYSNKKLRILFQKGMEKIGDKENLFLKLEKEVFKELTNKKN